VNGGPAVSTAANDANDDPANWSCRILGQFQVGTHVVVHENVPAGAEIDFIDTDPGSALFDFSTDTATNFANIVVGAGTTIVLFDDEAIPPSGFGSIEICKNPPGFQDPAVTGFWHYTLTDQNGDPVGPVGGVDVLTNQCSSQLIVPAGIITVAETARTGFQLVDAFTVPADALVGSNLINGTVDVEVPTSPTLSTQDEVEVAFVNKPITSQLKICKALGPNSSVLVGQRFYFKVTDITDPMNPVTLGSTSVIAPGCKIFGTIPTGTVVQVDEVSGPDDPATTQDDSNTAFITTTSPQTTTIGPGTANTVTITNTAFGLLEICKDAVAGVNTQPNFQYRIDNGAIITQRAGICGPARPVSVGNHTVTEVASNDYQVTGIRVDPAGRLVGTPDLANRSVTVNVPYGPAGETVVTYTNAIKTGTVKVCKTIPASSTDSLAPAPNGRDFQFRINVETAPGVFTPQFVTVHLEPGATQGCSAFTGPIPVLQTDGTNTIIGVQETTTGNFVVDDITLSFTRGFCSGTAPNPGPFPGANCIPTGKSTATQNVNFFLAPNPQFPTFFQHAT
jgi:hypothetical protein